jgi:hypothetical protein
MTRVTTNINKSKINWRKLIKILIPAAILIAIAVKIIYPFPSEFTFYELDDGTYAVGNYEGTWPYVTIPSSYKGKPVSYIVYAVSCLNDNVISVTVPESITAVNVAAFASNHNLKKVTLPETLTEISDNMFYKCENLEEVNISKSVTKIGCNSFYNCKSLKKIYINSGITSIGEPITNRDVVNQIYGDLYNVIKTDETAAFAGCTGIEEFVVNENNQYFTSVDGLLYNKDKTVLIAYPPAKTDTSFNIPESVIKINADAFNGCFHLESITIPSSVTEIGINAFMDCSSIKELNMPETVTNIGSGAFFGCSSLETINIPKNTTGIEDNLFYNCGFKSFILPENITWIGENAFSSCDKLTEISIPEKIVKIGDNAFFSCESLKAINVDTENQCYTDIDGVLFNINKTMLIQYPSGKDDVANYAVPNSVTIINYNAFNSCILKSIIYPKNLGEQIIFPCNCDNLEYITIPDIVANQVLPLSSPNLDTCFDYSTEDFWAGGKVNNKNHYLLALNGGWFSENWPEDLTLTKKGHDFVGWSEKNCYEIAWAGSLPEESGGKIYYAVFKEK